MAAVFYLSSKLVFFFVLFSGDRPSYVTEFINKSRNSTDDYRFNSLSLLSLTINTNSKEPSFRERKPFSRHFLHLP